MVCKNVFHQLKHFKQHLTDRPNCKSKSPYACKTCEKFVGHNEQSFDSHLTKNVSCNFYYKERNVASGLLNDSTLPCIKSNNNCNDVTSYLFKRYSTDGVVDNVQLNLKDDSVQNIASVRKVSGNLPKRMDVNTYMTNYRAVAGVTNNDTSSGSLQLVHNNPRDTNNDFCCNNDDEIDNIQCTPFDNDNVILENEEVILPTANVPLVIIAENDDTNEYTNVAFDIRVEQKALEKRFSSMTLTSSKLICFIHRFKHFDCFLINTVFKSWKSHWRIWSICRTWL